MNRTPVVLFVILFLLIIGLPLGANLAGVDGADPSSENREMAPFPQWTGTWTSASAFPAGLSRWFEDHFGFRDLLSRWYAESRLFGLRVSSSNSVVLGRNGWLFYADDGGIEDYLNKEALTPQDVAVWREAVVRAHTWLGARHVAYVFTIAPDKHAIYPEYMPSSIRPLAHRPRTDQVYDALEGTGVAAVDVRPSLLEAKARERVYFITDTHWNDRGAYIAYRQILDAVRRQVPSTPPAWSREEFESNDVVIAGKDLARMLGLARVLHETDLRLSPKRPRRARVVDPPGTADPMAELGRIVTEVADSRLPRAVIFRDSFGSRLAPFLSEHFSRAVYLWQKDFDAPAVLDEHPDVVIEEIAGRHLYGFIASPELVPR